MTSKDDSNHLNSMFCDQTTEPLTQINSRGSSVTEKWKCLYWRTKPRLSACLQFCQSTESQKSIANTFTSFGWFYHKYFNTNLELQYTEIVLTFWYFQKNIAGSVQRQHLTSPTQNHYYMNRQAMLAFRKKWLLLIVSVIWYKGYFLLQE